MKKKQDIKTEQEIDVVAKPVDAAVAEDGQLELAVVAVNEVQLNDNELAVELVAASAEAAAVADLDVNAAAAVNGLPDEAAVDAAAELVSPAQVLYEAVQEIDFLSEQEEIELTAGQMLTQARQQAEIDVDNLAYAFKVPKRNIQSLEADKFDQLPNLVFARCLASSICRYLKIDDTEILDKMPPANVELAARQDHVVERRGMLDSARTSSLFMATGRKISRFKPSIVLSLVVAVLVLTYLLLSVNIKQSWISSWQTSVVPTSNAAEVESPKPLPNNELPPRATQQLRTLD